MDSKIMVSNIMVGKIMVSNIGAPAIRGQECPRHT
jgi:hypothetical protein